MIEVFAEKLGPILVTDSVAKFDLLTSVPRGNGQGELQPICRVIIPISEVENIVGRLHEHLREHVTRLNVTVEASADGPADRGPVAPAQVAIREATQEATQSVVVVTIPKIRT
jgi:hypothetical protein